MQRGRRKGQGMLRGEGRARLIQCTRSDFRLW
jgi:hypothetical protein